MRPGIRFDKSNPAKCLLISSYCGDDGFIIVIISLTYIRPENGATVAYRVVTFRCFRYRDQASLVEAPGLKMVDDVTTLLWC